MIGSDPSRLKRKPAQNLNSVSTKSIGRTKPRNALESKIMNQIKNDLKKEMIIRQIKLAIDVTQERLNKWIKNRWSYYSLHGQNLIKLENDTCN